MISEEVKNKLKESWGSKAGAMDCDCEVKFIDPDHNWACYVYALNPEDEDEIECIIEDKKSVETARWSLSDMRQSYKWHGKHLRIDREFRKRNAAQVFKKLKEGR